MPNRYAITIKKIGANDVGVHPPNASYDQHQSPAVATTPKIKSILAIVSPVASDPLDFPVSHGEFDKRL